MILAHTTPLLIRLLLMLLVVSMIRVEQIGELADLVLHVSGFDLGIVEVGMLQFLAQVPEWMLHLVLEAVVALAGAICLRAVRHCLFGRSSGVNGR